MSSRNAASLLLRLICLFAAYRAAISILDREQSKAKAEMHLVPFFHLTEIPLVPFTHFWSKLTLLVPFSCFSEMPSIHFLPSIEDHYFTCCCFPQIQPSFLVNRPSVFWEWDKVVVKMSDIGSLWVIRYTWQFLSNENFDWHFLETTCWPMWSYKL